MNKAEAPKKEQKYTPINDMIVLEPVANVSPGGIILNGNAENKGIIKAVAPGIDIKIGSTVIFNKHAKIESGIDSLLLIKKDQIYLILE